MLGKCYYIGNMDNFSHHVLTAGDLFGCCLKLLDGHTIHMESFFLHVSTAGDLLGDSS